MVDAKGKTLAKDVAGYNIPMQGRGYPDIAYHGHWYQ